MNDDTLLTFQRKQNVTIDLSRDLTIDLSRDLGTSSTLQESKFKGYCL